MAQQFYRGASQVPVYRRAPTATVEDLRKKFGDKFKSFGEAYNYADIKPGIYGQGPIGGSEVRGRETKRLLESKRGVGDWLKSASTPEGKYVYDYSRKISGGGIDYGTQEGDWQIKRTWEGRPGKLRGQVPGYSTGTSTATMPRSWSPEATQFPWQARKGISSDFSRQQAFMKGFGGGEGAMRRPTYRRGQTFNPETAFADRTFNPKTGFTGTPTYQMGGGFPSFGPQAKQVQKETVQPAKQVQKETVQPAKPVSSGIAERSKVQKVLASPFWDLMRKRTMRI